MTKREILKEARKQAGFTQVKMAEYFGIPKRTYEDWEGEAREISDYLLRLMIYKLETEKLVSDLQKECP